MGIGCDDGEGCILTCPLLQTVEKTMAMKFDPSNNIVEWLKLAAKWLTFLWCKRNLKLKHMTKLLFNCIPTKWYINSNHQTTKKCIKNAWIVRQLWWNFTYSPHHSKITPIIPNFLKLEGGDNRWNLSWAQGLSGHYSPKKKCRKRNIHHHSGSVGAHTTTSRAL